MANGDALLPGLLPADQRYEVLRTLGQGAYGVVALARDKDTNEKACADARCPVSLGQQLPPAAYTTSHRLRQGYLQCAIKFIERTEVAKHHKHVRREVVNHSSLLHPHVRAWVALSLHAQHLLYMPPL